MLELLDISAANLAVCCAVVLLGSFVRGYSGFGFSAILMAGLGLVLDPAEIVPIAIALEVLASLGQARQVWDDINWRSLAVILLTGIAGNPVGVWLLLLAPGENLLAFVYLFIGAVSGILLASPRLNVPPALPVLAGAGLLAGIVNGATALSGLVLALLFTIAGVSPAIMRATFVAYFFVTDLWTGALLAGSGLYDLETIWRILASLPLLAFGLWLGSRRFLGTPPQSFRRMTLALLISLSAIGLARLALA